MRYSALNNFSDQFKNDQTFTVADVLDGISAGKYTLCFNDKDEYGIDLFIATVNKTLPYLMDVVRNPNVVLNGKFEIKRAEMATSLTPAGIRETIRDVRLWKRFNNQVRPADVYDTVNVEEMNTYENRVVKALIDRMIRILLYETDRYSAGVKTLCGTRGQYGNINKIDLMRLLDGKQFLSTSAVSYTDYIRIAQLKKNFLRLRNSPFYEEMCHYQPFNERVVELTDVFYMSKKYRMCYDLWNFLNKSTNSVSVSVKDNSQSLYCAYITIALADAYKKLGYKIIGDCKINNLDTHFVLNGVVFIKNGITITLRAVPERIEVLVQCSRANVQQRISIGICPDYQENDDLKNQYTVTLDGNQYTDTVLCVRPDVPDTLNNIAALAQLTVLTQSVAAGIYENVCPVCGKTAVIKNNLSYGCEECGSVWTFVDPETLWINHFKSYSK